MDSFYFVIQIKTAKPAQLCGISEKHFRSLFKVTPTQYIMRLRLDTAVKLLQQGGFAIGEIAEMVGIPDTYYFSKSFKKQFRVRPSISILSSNNVLVAMVLSVAIFYPFTAPLVIPST